jgi:sugar phosphate isomerase/epimerase
MALKIGLIGIIGEELKADPWGTLQRVAEIGYEGIEGAAGLARRADVSVAEVKVKLDGLGLASVAQGGTFMDPDDEKLPRAIDAARESGADYVVSYWAPCESRDQVLTLAEALDAIGAKCREGGLTFCYHNHNQEFAAFDGEYGLDILLANTDPANVQAELDVAWVTYGGGDPVAMIHKYAGRCPILHMKDLAVVPEGGETGNEGRKETQFTEVGTGVVNTAGAVEAAREAGVEWLVVEQDRMRNLAPMDSIRVSYENLKRIVG